MEHTLGFICGVAIGVLLIVLISFLITKFSGKKSGFWGKANYDERQMRARGEASKWGLIAMCCSTMGVSVIGENFNIDWLLSVNGSFMAMMFGLIVFASVCVWKEAYVSLSENYKGTIAMLIVCGMLNIVCAITNTRGCDYSDIDELMRTVGSFNFIAAAFIIILLVQVVAKMIVNNIGGDADEES